MIIDEIRLFSVICQGLSDMEVSIYYWQTLLVIDFIIGPGRNQMVGKNRETGLRFRRATRHHL